MSRLILTKNAIAGVSGNVTVFGTASGSETVQVFGGNVVLDASFGRGGDTVRVMGNAGDYSVRLNGSTLVLSNGTTTVFVPTNKAFEKLSKERLQALIDPANKQYLERVLTYHAAHNTRIDRYVLRRIGFLRSGLGQYLKINPDRTGDVITVDGATIEEYDLACSNGVVHFIDTVLDPIELDLFEYLEKDGRFTILTKLIKRSGQTKLFQNRHDVYTVFAPTDEAFAALPAGTVENLLKPENKDQLAAILSYHVVARELTKRFEQTKRGTLAELHEWAAEGTKGELVLVVAGGTSDTADLAQVASLAVEKISAGEPTSAVVQELAKIYNVSKNELYDLVLQLKPKQTKSGKPAD